MCRIRLWHPFVHGTTGCCKKHLQFLRVKNSGSFFHPPLPPLSTTIRMPWSVVSGPIWCPESSCNIHFHIAPFGCSGIAKRLWGENLPDGRRRLMPPEAEKQKISKVTAASHWLIFPELRSWLDYSGIWQIMTGYNDYRLRVIIEIDYKNFGLADASGRAWVEWSHLPGTGGHAANLRGRVGSCNQELALEVWGLWVPGTGNESNCQIARKVWIAPSKEQGLGTCRGIASKPAR